MTLNGGTSEEAPRGADHGSNRNIEQQHQDITTTRSSESEPSESSWYTASSGLGESLCQAVAADDEPAVQHLLQYGANPDLPGNAGKTPLFIAAEKGLFAMIELLLANGASVDSQVAPAQSTALIRACEQGHEAVAHLLVEAGADLEARDQDGRTPLYVAVSAANERLTRYLLQHGADKRARLADGTTVMDCAQGNESLLDLLRQNHLLQGPKIGSLRRPSPHAQFKSVVPPVLKDDAAKVSAAEKMHATVMAFFIGQREQRSPPVIVSVYDLLYSKGPDAVMEAYTSKARSNPTFTWYHLPANNTIWVNDLITRLLADRNNEAAMPDDKFMSNIGLKKPAKDHKKRTGRNRFTRMRPSCNSFVNERKMSWREDSLDGVSAFIPFLSSELYDDYAAMSTHLSMARKNARKNVARLVEPETLERARVNISQPNKSKKGRETLIDWFSSAPAPRRRRRTNHLEQTTGDRMKTNPNEAHIRAYSVPEANGGQIPYQPRLSLDQYHYLHLKDTTQRDKDQVIYRYTDKPRSFKTPKIFMVDQLWIWLINGDTLITCAPNQWRHGSIPSVGDGSLLLGTVGESLQSGPFITADNTCSPDASSSANPVPLAARKPEEPVHEPEFSRDPLSIHQKAIEHLHKRVRKPITSLHDLAGLVATCCASTFDENQVPDEYRFFDFFEASISIINERMTRSFHDFKRSLANRANPHSTGSASETSSAGSDELNLNTEIDLVVEAEDIRDELHILKTVLIVQKQTITELEAYLSEAQRKSQGNESRDLVDYSCIDGHISRINGMNELNERALTSLRHHIDLKQQQASFSEAIYTRELARQTAQNTELQIKQAQETSRQGKTLMVFTVVTIIFLPLSFMATFFTINVDVFPYDANGKIGINYIIKYMLGLGFAMAVPFVILAFSIDEIGHAVANLLGISRKTLDGGGTNSVKLRRRWRLPTIRFFAAGIIAIVVLTTGLVMVFTWTSTLGQQIKVTLTVCFGALFLVVMLGWGVSSKLRHGISGNSVSSCSTRSTSS